MLVDGVPAGRTDGDGVLQLALDEAPARIELDAPGLRPLPAYPAVRTRFGPYEPWHKIVMRP